MLHTLILYKIRYLLSVSLIVSLSLFLTFSLITIYQTLLSIRTYKRTYETIFSKRLK